MRDGYTLKRPVLVPSRRIKEGTDMLTEQGLRSAPQKMTRAEAALAPELWDNLAKIAPPLLTLASETLKQSQPALVQMIKRLNAKDEQIVVTVLKDMKQARLAVKRFGEILRTCETELIIAASRLQAEASKDFQLATDVPIIQVEAQHELAEAT